MKVDLSALAFAVRQLYAARGYHPLSTGHAQQLIASALGHGTLAALQASTDVKKLLEAVHVVVDDLRLNARGEELQLDSTAAALAVLDVFKDQLPGTVHRDTSAFVDALQEFVNEQTPNEGRVASEIDAIYGSVEEVYMPLEEIDEDLDLDVETEALSAGIAGHVAMEVDRDRPYAGHIIDVEATLIVDRLGKRLFARPELDVEHAQQRWYGDDRGGGTAKILLAQALAEVLGIEEADAESLDFIEVANESVDGVLYDIVLEFDKTAPPDIADKIRALHPTLSVRVPPDFFEHVHRPD